MITNQSKNQLMNTKILTALASAIVIMALCASSIYFIKQKQKLGEPGVKISSDPIYDENGKLWASNSVVLPQIVAEFDSQPVPISSIELKTLPSDTTYGRRLYHAPDGFEILVSAVLMGTDRTSIHKPQFCLTGQGWSIEKTELIEIQIPNHPAKSIPAMKIIANMNVKQKSGTIQPLKGLYIYWFVEKNNVTASHHERMWLMAKSLLTHAVLQRWAYISAFHVCEPGKESISANRMVNFLSKAIPSMLNLNY